MSYLPGEVDGYREPLLVPRLHFSESSGKGRKSLWVFSSVAITVSLKDARHESC